MNTIPDNGKNSTIFFDGEHFIIVTLSGYRSLRMDFSVEDYIMGESTPNEELGLKAVLAARAGRVVPPDDAEFYNLEKSNMRYDAWVAKSVKALKFKSKRAFYKNKNRCGFNIKDEIITIKPSNHVKNDAWSGDGIKEEDKVKLPESSSYEDIGAAIRLAFTRCKSRV